MAFVELVVRARTREEASAVLLEQIRLSATRTWDTSVESCERILAWLRQDEDPA